jgi:hypothetical protein
MLGYGASDSRLPGVSSMQISRTPFAMLAQLSSCILSDRYRPFAFQLRLSSFQSFGLAAFQVIVVLVSISMTWFAIAGCVSTFELVAAGARSRGCASSRCV